MRQYEIGSRFSKTAWRQFTRQELGTRWESFKIHTHFRQSISRDQRTHNFREKCVRLFAWANLCFQLPCTHDAEVARFQVFFSRHTRVNIDVRGLDDFRCESELVSFSFFV